MVAAINFLAGNFGITNLAGSGLGFFGNAWGQSVNVGAWQNTTFITNAAGTSQGPQVNNIQYLNSRSGVINSATSGVLLTQIPNYLATLNVRFTNDTPVQAIQVQAWIYDRSNINNSPSGVVTQVAELIHLDTVQNNNGSGSAMWNSLGGSSNVLTLANSPGLSGIYAGNGSNSTVSMTEHDWFLAVAQSPSTIGSKLSALYLTLEYL